MLSQRQAQMRLDYLLPISSSKSDSCTRFGSLNCRFNIAFLILIVLLEVTITAPDLLNLWLT